MSRGVLYLRLSKEDVDKMNKGDDSESIVNQRLLLMDYAVEHKISIIDIYSDDDYSGLYDDRPEFDRLIKDSRLGKFEVVIAKSQSRFTRNMEHMEKYLHHDFPLLGIRFIGVVDGVDTNEKGNKKARQIYGLTNEWYCEDLSENIKAVFRQKMKNGQFIGAFAPYGYVKASEDKHQMEVDETAAEVVRKIFQLYLNGNSIKQICYRLEDEKIPNPTVYKKQQGLSYSNIRAEEFGKKYNFWSETTVKHILKNETYLGKLVQGTSKKISYKDKKVVSVPKEEWIVVDHHHEPIIEEHIFEKVQRMMERRRVATLDYEGGKKIHPFAGKIRCSDCGSTMIKSGGVRGDAKDWYLRCQLSNKSRLKECTSHSIRYSAIEKSVSDVLGCMINDVLESIEERKEILDCIMLLNDKAEEMEKKGKYQRVLIEKQEKAAKALSFLYHDRVEGRISEEIFLQLKVEFEEEYKEMKEELATLQKEISVLEELGAKLGSEEELLHQYWDFKSLTNEMVVDFVDYIEVFEKDRKNNFQKICIHWNV